jgi:hypothetical protein
MSISNYAELKLLDAVFNHTTTGGGLPTADVWIQLHTDDPGEDCTADVATEDTRKQVSMAPADAGSCASDGDVSWTSVAADETYAYISIWDASTDGHPLWSGELTTPKTVNTGDTFTISSGDLTASLD